MQIFLLCLFIIGALHHKILKALVYFLISHLSLRIQQNQTYLQNYPIKPISFC